MSACLGSTSQSTSLSSGSVSIRAAVAFDLTLGLPSWVPQSKVQGSSGEEAVGKNKVTLCLPTQRSSPDSLSYDVSKARRRQGPGGTRRCQGSRDGWTPQDSEPVSVLEASRRPGPAQGLLRAALSCSQRSRGLPG